MNIHKSQLWIGWTEGTRVLTHPQIIALATRKRIALAVFFFPDLSRSKQGSEWSGTLFALFGDDSAKFGTLSGKSPWKNETFYWGSSKKAMCRSPLVARDLVLYIPISADATRMKEDTTDAWARASWSRCDSFFCLWLSGVMLDKQTYSSAELHFSVLRKSCEEWLVV